MQKFKSFMFALLCGIATVGMSATSAHALLIEKDLNTAGDKLITLDTVTGLEWLDVTATLNLSYNQAAATSFVTAQGFRHANQPEVRALYASAGVTDLSGVFVAANFSGVQELLAKLGCTADCGPGQFSFQQGFSDGVPFDAIRPAVPFVQLALPPGLFLARAFQVVDTDLFLSVDKNLSNVAIGSYLLRASSIPEPSSWALMVFGLTALAWFRRRRGNG